MIEWIRCLPYGLHLKSTIVEIRCFYYLNSNVITIKNNSRIIINWEISLFVIITTTFLLSFDKWKGKHLIYFKCIHEHYSMYTLRCKLMKEIFISLWYNIFYSFSWKGIKNSVWVWADFNKGLWIHFYDCPSLILLFI